MRLAQEVTRLRETKGLSQLELAQEAGFKSRYAVQALESGELKPNLGHVLQIVEALGIDQDTEEWREFHRVARAAARKGWWDERGYKQMGDRQRAWADLELGASLRSYEHTLVPGLLQTEQYYRDLNVRVGEEADEKFDPEVGVAGRLERQRQFQQGDGTLSVVIEEIALQHLFVARATMQAQLEHLAEVADTDRIQIRVIPTRVEVELRGVRAPRVAFTVFSRPSAKDPDIVLLEGIDEDNIHVEPERVRTYVRLYERLADAALPPKDSAAYLARLAGELNPGRQNP